MQLVLKAIRPHLDEVIGYVVVGLLVLVAFNIAEIIDIVFVVSQTDMDVQTTVDTSLVGMIREVAMPLNGRLGNSVVWAFMGIIAFGLGSIVVAELQDLFDHSEQARDTPRHFRNSVWGEFFVRTILRTLALVGLIAWIYIFFAYISPYISRALLEAMLAPNGIFWGTLVLVVGGVIIGISLYSVAVFCRFIALRVRVFTDEPL